MPFECPVCTSENDDSAIACSSCGAPLQSPTAGSGGGQTAADHISLSPGSLLHQNKYRVEGLLGAGGFGITYKGTELANAKTVAIKELWPEKAARQGTSVAWPSSIPPKEKLLQINKFKLEAQYQSRCVHPNIVEVYEWFEQNNTAYIVMEFVQGKSLYEIFEQEGILSESRIKRYFTQISEALSVVHSQNFLHRDIKPDNILISPKDDAVLIDFGSTREFMAGQTREMSVTLTKGYAPIEQYSYNSKRWPATDFYALCASMYELLTGELPTEAVLRLQGEPLIPPRQKVPNLSSLMEKVILHGMKVKVEERFQTADELISALNGRFVATGQKRARDLVRQNKLAEASQAYKTCLANEPDNAEATVELALVQVYTDAKQAQVVARQAVQLAPNEGRGYGVLGLIACQQANWTEAYGHLQRAVSLAPSEAWIQANYAWALGKIGRWREAEAAADRALTIDPNNLFTRGLKAWIAIQQQQWKRALSYAAPTIFQTKQNPSNNNKILQPWVYPLLILSLNQVVTSQAASNDVDRHVQAFIAQNPNSAIAWSLQGWREAARGQWGGAQQNFEKAAQLYAPPAWALTNLGVACERQGDAVGAIAAYESCIQQYPDSGYACFRLGTVLAQQGNWPLAKEVLERAATLLPEYAAAHHNLAWTLLRMPGDKGKSDFRQILLTYRTAVSLYERQNHGPSLDTIKRAFAVIGITL